MAIFATRKMGKRIYYKYNPETDNFERHYPSLRDRVVALCRLLAAGTLIGALLFFIVYFCLGTPSEEKLRAENAELRRNYSLLERRLDESLKVMKIIQKRDDNFYRVMLQMDPVSSTRRNAGLENKTRYENLATLSDAALVSRLDRRMNQLEHQLYVQSQSFDELRAEAQDSKNKLDHIPAVAPVRISESAISSGYGYRRNPVLGTTRFHAGLDLSARVGTPVYATADGTVYVAERKEAYGNCVEINHGYNYLTRYAHLDQIKVHKGDNIKRGDLIGYVGNTGSSVSPHLHYEVRFKGQPQNPINYYFMELTPSQFAVLSRTADDAAEVLD